MTQTRVQKLARLIQGKTRCAYTVARAMAVMLDKGDAATRDAYLARVNALPDEGGVVCLRCLEPRTTEHRC